MLLLVIFCHSEVDTTSRSVYFQLWFPVNICGRELNSGITAYDLVLAERRSISPVFTSYCEFTYVASSNPALLTVCTWNILKCRAQEDKI